MRLLTVFVVCVVLVCSGCGMRNTLGEEHPSSLPSSVPAPMETELYSNLKMLIAKGEELAFEVRENCAYIDVEELASFYGYSLKKQISESADVAEDTTEYIFYFSGDGIKADLEFKIGDDEEYAAFRHRIADPLHTTANCVAHYEGDTLLIPLSCAISMFGFSTTYEDGMMRILQME